MLRNLIAILMLSITLYGQQPFNPLRSVSAGNSQFCSNGILCVDLNNPNSAPNGITYFATIGPHLQNYDMWVSLSPPIPNNIVTAYGIVDLDTSNSFLWFTGTLSLYPSPLPPAGTNIEFFGIDVSTVVSPFNATLQALITDPSASGGYVLSNALHYFK